MNFAMARSFRFWLFIGPATCALADKPLENRTNIAQITGPVAGYTPAAPSPPPASPDFQIEGTQIRLVDVVESPPMSDLPPVTGTITIKVHQVVDPGLPDPPMTLPPLAVDDPQVIAKLAALSAKYRKTRSAFLSATVYHRSRTLLTCYPNGHHEKAVKFWSNLDFNHFSGFGTFEVTGTEGEVRSYALIMGIGNENPEFRRKRLAYQGIPFVEPEIPAFSDDGPSFVILTENPDPEGVELVEDLHALYRHEGKRMAEACAAREKAHAERKAYLLANPPKPKDVTMHFWKREQPVGMAADTIKQ
jgi:hypothetical protein